MSGQVKRASRSVLLKGFYEQLCVGEGNKPEIGSTSKTLSDDPGASERASKRANRQANERVGEQTKNI